MWTALGKLARDTKAAVAPTVALSLFALIASGGIAFDYARLAALDTELQQAADQAALAAATQLDRTANSQTHATAAISDPTVSNRLAANLTKFANDSNSAGLKVELEAIIFCKAFDDTKPDTANMLASSGGPCTPATNGTDSSFVIVRTTARTAKYALTPIVAALSGTVKATAVAGVQSSICNVAPLLVCAPSDDFPTAADIGKGMIMKVSGGGKWVPGNYGLLDFGNGKPAVIKALMEHGLNGCQATDDNETEPGNADVTGAINTRFDVYDGAKTKVSDCKSADGAGCPALNTGKDMVRTENYVVDTEPTVVATPAAPACGQAGTGFPGELTLGTAFAQDSAAAAFARDTCHYSSCAGGNYGDKNWSRDAYFLTNYGWNHDQWIANTGLSATVTRFEVYDWELAHDTALNTLGPRAISAPAPATELKKIKGKDRKVWTFTKRCSYHRPIFATTGYPAQKDRRILPVVAANCDNLKGKGAAFEDYVLLRAFDVFLTEPSLTRGGATPTDVKEIYGEIVGPAETFEGGSGFQYYSRNKPYLVR